MVYPRITENLYGNIFPSGDARTLAVVGVGHSETLTRLNGQFRVVSTPDVGDTTTYTGAFGTLLYDWGIFYSTWEFAAKYSPSHGSQPHIPANDAEWDAFFKKSVLSYGSAANLSQYGDADANEDKLRFKDNPAEPDRTTSDDGNADAIVDPNLPSYGPQGFYRLKFESRVLSSMTKVDAALTSSASAVYNGNTNLNDMVYTDSIMLQEQLNLPGPGFLIIGVIRKTPVISQGYNCSYGVETGHTGDNVLSAADKIEIFNDYYGGNLLRIKEILRDRTTLASNYIRTMLWMGDVNLKGLDATNNPTISAMFADNNPIRTNDLKIDGTMFCDFMSPYSIVPDLM